MKKLIPFVCLVVISLICPKIPSDNRTNLDRFQKLVVFGDSLSDNGNTFRAKRDTSPTLFSGALDRS